MPESESKIDARIIELTSREDKASTGLCMKGAGLVIACNCKLSQNLEACLEGQVVRVST